MNKANFHAAISMGGSVRRKWSFSTLSVVHHDSAERRRIGHPRLSAPQFPLSRITTVCQGSSVLTSSIVISCSSIDREKVRLEGHTGIVRPAARESRRHGALSLPAIVVIC